MQVEAKEAGLTLLAFLKTRCPSALSVKSLKRALDAKRCMVNGQVETFASYRLQIGDRVFLEEEVPQLPLHVLYEDEWLYVIDKPAGLISQNGQYPLIHRLDKETSGVLMFAKSEQARLKMIELFRKGKIQKRYLAIVQGQMNQPCGEIQARLKRLSSPLGQAKYGVATSMAGDRAHTRWRCLKSTAKASLLYLEPVTGRTHQLRVHLSHIRHPILGDIQYGNRSAEKRHLLHAYTIAFPHPWTGQPLQVKALLPDDFQAALQRLQLC